MEKDWTLCFGVLAHPGRLAVFRLLMRRYPDAVAAGEVAAALDLAPSTLSGHLSALVRAGLAAQRRVATSLLYSADIEGARGLSEYLLQDCCRNRPDLCPSPRAADERTRAMPDSSYSVLFICTGNSARSIFAEALLRDLGGGRFAAHSAGTRPRSDLNPLAVRLLRDKGHDVSGLRAKTVAEFQGDGAPPLDFVFTVCDRAANEECPPWPGRTVTGHWSTPDPVKAIGTEAEKMLAFQQAYGSLRNRIVALAALPLESLDRLARQRAVDDIGRKDDL